MRNWRWPALASAILAIALLVHFVLPRSHVLFPPRASNGTDYVLYIHVPGACRAGGCPALYLLDGERWLPTFARIVDERARAHRMAPIVVVGIGYADILNTRARRKFDFTPAFDRAPSRTGGADAYHDVLTRELIPFAEAHLPIAPGARGIAGHSYGGLFATYALMRAPDLFDRYLIMSPALWFDEGKIYTQPFATAAAPRQVILAANTPQNASSNMARDVMRLTDLLSQRADLAVSRTMILGANHNSMVTPAARRGLDALYGPDVEGNRPPP